MTRNWPIVPQANSEGPNINDSMFVENINPVDEQDSQTVKERRLRQQPTILRQFSIHETSSSEEQPFIDFGCDIGFIYKGLSLLLCSNTLYTNISISPMVTCIQELLC